MKRPMPTFLFSTLTGRLRSRGKRTNAEAVKASLLYCLPLRGKLLVVGFAA
jgi:hypothetical protein